MKKILLTMVGVATLAACVPNTPAPAAVDTSAIGMANPASVYCIEQGGKLETVKSTAGEVGMCHLPDGTTVEEWEFFRANHKG
jgi:putative hemolysin